MVYQKTLLAYLVPLLFFIGGCGTQEKEFNTAGSVIELHANEKFAIVLPETHSAGQSWRYKSKNDLEMVQYNGSTWHGEAVGAKFHFKSVATGTCLLNFSLYEYNKTADSCHFILKISE